jgi:hypothetical protein
MALPLRFALLAVFFGLTLTACGRTVQEDAPESVTSAVEEERAEDEEAVEDEEGEFSHLVDLMRTFRRSTNQTEMDAAVVQGRADGYSDEDIASAMGLAHLWTPARRVLVSVSYIRFKSQSATPSDVLNANYEYASTPPWLRNVEEESEEEEVEETPSDEESDDEAAEEEEPRRRGWFSWVPGL